MSDVTTQLLGIILGEIARIQDHLEMPSRLNKSVIEGLVEGVEPALDAVTMDGPLSSLSIRNVQKVLDAYHNNDDALDELDGFYDIEPKLEALGIDRNTAVRALRWLWNTGAYREVIKKFDSDNSPAECRRFDEPWPFDTP